MKLWVYMCIEQNSKIYMAAIFVLHILESTKYHFIFDTTSFSKILLRPQKKEFQEPWKGHLKTISNSSHFYFIETDILISYADWQKHECETRYLRKLSLKSKK